MNTQNISTLRIHKLTQAQYDRELEAGNIDENALYLTPDEETDLSGYATKKYVNDSISAVVQDTFGAVFYESLAQAIADINNDVSTNAIEDLSLAKVKVFTADNGTLTVMLLDNISESAQININKDINLVLNGKTLSFTDSTAFLNFGEGISCTINGEVNGSTIAAEFSNVTAKYYIAQVYGNTFIVKGGTYHINGDFSAPVGVFIINQNAKSEFINCAIDIKNTNETTDKFTYGIVLRSSSEALIENLSVRAEAVGNCSSIHNLGSGTVKIIDSNIHGITYGSQINPRAEGAYNFEISTMFIKDSNVTADSPGCGNNESQSSGIRNMGTVFCENAYVNGTYSGLANRGNLYVNGGTYLGYSYGGFQFTHGVDGIAYVNDATIKGGSYDGIFDYSGKTEKIKGSFVVGGSDEKNSNITVYLDNCTIDEGFVLRGANEEQNNTVNVSNSNLTIKDSRLISIDDDTHKLNIGVGTNITTDMTNNPSYTEFTNELYRKLHENQVCDGDDYNALVNFLNYLKS